MAKRNTKTTLNIDEAIDLIREGYSYRKMCDHFGVSMGALTDFFARAEHSARVREALIASADTYAEKAETVLLEATWKDKGQDFDLKKARELAQHYRWMAAKRNPGKYSERTVNDNNNTNTNINANIDASSLTDEDLRALIEIQRKSGAGTP